eukprot:TRINITY_DN17607_c0_g1_i3.p1 TRINITY_DN17607_c0_g1~~TRINITY_DN17607_c0_g1_i3.p1  ORF type:complete len:752 (-),score=114.17 TRINITY_DN17607_c0_g1_i3:131-2386(-)
MSVNSDGSPVQAVILAAGRASRLAPYTDTVPTALIDICEMPMIAHCIGALRGQGVRKFIVCRGWQGDAFDKHLKVLGEGIILVDCPEFATVGMLVTLQKALPHLDDGGFYVLYGDILFRSSVARQAHEAAGEICVVVNAAKPGHESKGFSDVEVVTTCGPPSSSIVRRIGKNRTKNESDVVGEFAGIVKITASAQSAFVSKVFQVLPAEGSVPQTEFCVPWWLEPVEKASLCDFLQLLADSGSLTPTIIFAGWHEVNTPYDLARARNDTAAFLSVEDTRAQVAAMGACLLSEANDLKRPLPTVARELNIPLAKIQCILAGDLEVSEALDVLRKMNEVYPVPLNDLWLDADDTTCGVRLCSADASEASSRILDRLDRHGKRTPYYEYRDAAMSRCSQFRPEWIKQLRLVQNDDPLDPDVQLNNGHLMMQTTLFIGPVDFYWKDRFGAVQKRSMQTGDSNFISPFVPHSFTTRDPNTEALIIAVTYGGSVRRAFTEFSRVGAKCVMDLAGDLRDPILTRKCVLQRCLSAECFDTESFFTAVREASSDITKERLRELLEGNDPSEQEVHVLASALNVRPRDLQVCPMQDDEEVVLTYAADKSHQDVRRFRTYLMAPLARTKHQPDLKTFDLEVLDTACPGEDLSCGLHTFVYHFGSQSVEFAWEGRRGRQVALLRPGDSAYIAPSVTHRFSVVAAESTKDQAVSNPNGSACGDGRRIFLVRIPGHLTGETLAEFATFSAFGRSRVGAETEQWYN